MRSYAFAIRFRNDAAIDAYRELHHDVWPEVKTAFESIGLKSLQLYHMPPLDLFMYIEATEAFVAERDFKGYVNLHPRVKEWDEVCGALLARLQSNKGVTDWAPMTKIYAYDRRPHRVFF